MTRQRRLGVALLFATVIAMPRGLAAANCGQAAFDIPVTFPASRVIPFLANGDFNGDTVPDVAVVTNDNDNGIFVMLGNPDGSLSAPQAFASGTNTTLVVVGDFDLDGALDAIGGPQLEFFEGNGDGTFQAAVFLGESMVSPVAADLDGDGNLDLIGIDSQELSVMLGAGGGTFAPPVGYPLPGFAQSVALGDVDGNGEIDAVVAVDATPSILVFPGNGDGTFGNSTPVGTLSSGHVLLLADFDGDSALDIVIDDNSLAPSGIAVFLNQGGGVFSPPTSWPTPTTRLLAADLDADGHLDIVATQSGSPGPGLIRLLYGNGDGTFAEGEDYVGGDRSAPVIAVDFSSSGPPDLVYPTAGEASVSILINRRDRRFGGLRVTGSSFIFVAAFGSGDFDEDGFPDLAIGTSPSFQSADFFLYRGDASGAFSRYGELQLNVQVFGIQTADFTSDGHLDILINAFAGGFFILPGNGNGTFGAQIGIGIATYGPGKAVIEDLDGDGDMDLVLVVSGSNGPELGVLLGDGQGHFPDFLLQPLPGFPEFLTGGTFDGDGHPDVAVSIGPAAIAILLGRGDGSFDVDDVYDPGPVGEMTTGDVDGNGIPDIVASGRNTGTVRVLIGRGDGAFDVRTVGLGWESQGVAVADFDGDGFGDILTANPSSGNATVLMSRGDGTFRSPFAIPVGEGAFGVESADFSGDGTRDALVGTPRGVVSLRLAALQAVASGDSSVVVGSPAVFSSSASGFGRLTYQWRREGAPLGDGGPVTGANTATLTIDPVSFTDAGSYDVVVTDACGGSVTSNTVTLAVEFADVPVSSPFHDDILAIATAGITSGCGGGNYCPGFPVRRDQMAVFLLKTEHGSAYTPPACTGVFTDVPCPSAFADWVEQLAAEGVTGGCGGGNYCPDASVTRAQMAVFLLKTSEGSAYTPPPATGIFGDVPVGSFAPDFIEDLYNRGITGGCQASPPLYCPGNAVLRQQMATFLVRTFLTP